MKRLLPIVSALKGLSLPRWGAAFACLALAGCAPTEAQGRFAADCNRAGGYVANSGQCYAPIKIPPHDSIVGLQGGDIAGAGVR